MKGNVEDLGSAIEGVSGGVGALGQFKKAEQELRESTDRFQHMSEQISMVEDVTDRKGLAEEMLRISEREQQRFGQDLHDGLCQNLVAVKFKAMLLEKKLSQESSEETAGARAIVELLNQAIQEAYDLAKGLQPVNIGPEGLPCALEDLATKTQSRFDVRCTFRSRSNGFAGSTNVGTHLYRIAQEAVSNAIRHGRASRLFINLVARNDRLALTVKDNGAGFSGSPPQHGGMGLNIMNYRASAIGASLAIRRRVNGGTRVTCALPLFHQNALDKEKA